MLRANRRGWDKSRGLPTTPEDPPADAIAGEGRGGRRGGEPEGRRSRTRRGGGGGRAGIAGRGGEEGVYPCGGEVAMACCLRGLLTSGGGRVGWKWNR